MATITQPAPAVSYPRSVTHPSSEWLDEGGRPASSRSGSHRRPSDIHGESSTSTPASTPKTPYLKIASACFCFFIGGVNIGSLGALVPYIIRDYVVSTAIVSSVYGATFAGWVFAACSSAHLSQYLDTGGILLLGTALQLAAHALRAWLPPFGLLVATFWLAAVGQAYNDAQANAFVASAASRGAHRWLALLHATFMAGCLVGPFVATAVAFASSPSSLSRGGAPPPPLSTRWYLFYIFPAGLSVLSLAFISVAFRDRLSVKQKAGLSAPSSSSSSSSPGGEEARREEEEEEERARASRNKHAVQLIKSSLRRPSVWLLGMFYFFYLGSQVTMNGWVVEYLVQVRDGDLAKMGFVPAGFNGGCMLGRLLLAEPTYRLGERRMVFIYCCVAVGLQLIFWLVPNIIAASIAVAFIGFFTGPLFATGISMSSKLFPPETHSTAIVFVLALAQLGAGLFPAITGIIASRAGVHVLQPILTAILAASAVSWLLVPRPKASPNAALHQE